MLLPLEYAVRNLGRSPLRLVLTVATAAVVALLVMAASGFVRGMHESLGASAAPRNVLLLGAGSEESLERSEIAPGVGELVAGSVDGIASLLGVPLVSPEVHVALPLGAGDERPVAVVRGITQAAYLVHPQVRIIEGRAPEPGTMEVLLGRETERALRMQGSNGLDSAAVEIDGRVCPVVGILAAPGTIMEAEIWMPLASLRVLTQRDSDSCVVVALGSDGDPGDLDAFAAQRVDLELTSMLESDYYASLAQFLAPVRWLVVATAIIVAMGGMLGGLSILDAAFASRVRELGTLQSIGFRRRAILWSFMQESLLIAMTGALVAALLAVLFVDGHSVRSSMGAFAVRIDAVAIGAGLLAGVALGMVGAVVPAWRCLRLSIPESLKAPL